jgi:hypothetical protein
MLTGKDLSEKATLKVLQLFFTHITHKNHIHNDNESRKIEQVINGL